ncbi:hypothetical protein [Streptomyces griseosporeus]|uniref:hypothetical protein n=1 Tax=Streptomyces griseosporeus TaxID=1910 RepID=UPI00167C8DA5|nr:hypothetical protein [Streptomyces griseosporeus]GHF85527.1 hypothetical protein GCM10018783_64850 [Streptomyces griseosporeus]
MPATDSQPPPHRPYAISGLSMRDLLASCAAADAVSLPPRTPDPGTGTSTGTGTREVREERPQAA